MHSWREAVLAAEVTSCGSARGSPTPDNASPAVRILPSPSPAPSAEGTYAEVGAITKRGFADPAARTDRLSTAAPDRRSTLFRSSPSPGFQPSLTIYSSVMLSPRAAGVRTP